MRTLAILGGGGHGQDLAELVRRNRRYQFVGFYDDDPTVVDRLGSIAEFDPLSCHYLLGVNNPHARSSLSLRGLFGVYANPSVIDPSAVVAGDLYAGDGVVVAALTQVGPRVELGPHTHVGPGVTITRTKVGSYCTISPGATICGDVTIGDCTLIGAGAVVRNLITIGNDVTVGAGAVVVEDVPDGATVVGVPARSLALRASHRVTDEMLEEVATIYRAALVEPGRKRPIEAIIQRHTEQPTDGTARRWVILARERGFLGEATGTRAGEAC